jgi:hypothetical protein
VRSSIWIFTLNVQAAEGRWQALDNN